MKIVFEALRRHQAALRSGAIVTVDRGRDRVRDDQGRVRPHANVFVDRRSIRHTGGLAAPVANGAVLSVIPAVSGG